MQSVTLSDEKKVEISDLEAPSSSSIPYDQELQMDLAGITHSTSERPERQRRDSHNRQGGESVGRAMDDSGSGAGLPRTSPRRTASIIADIFKSEEAVPELTALRTASAEDMASLGDGTEGASGQGGKMEGYSVSDHRRRIQQQVRHACHHFSKSNGSGDDGAGYEWRMHLQAQGIPPPTCVT